MPLFGKEDMRFDSPLQLFIAVMMGALPEQAEFEAFFASERKADQSADLLANLCLDIFSSQTGVGIWQRVVDVRTRTLKLSFAAYDDLLGGPRKMLHYSPSYCMLTGFGDAPSYQVLRAGSSDDLASAVADAHDKLVSDMMAFFWRQVDAFPYVATPSLRTTLGKELRAYLASGLTASGGFVPPSSLQFSFFLYGGAGTGKSTLVSAFAKALQATLVRFVDAGRRADIVKVPLNGLTPESLGMILRVQGISDMSIERLLEQAVSRGNTAILHLEEIPEDVELQEALVSTVKSMLSTSLLRRYHQFAGNVILAFTSNYPAAPNVAVSTTEITVVAPSPTEQSQHCVRMLESNIKEATGAADVNVELKYALPLMDDMRPLCQWWTTLSYHISEWVMQHTAVHELGLPPYSIAAVLSSANGGGMITIDLKVDHDAMTPETEQASTTYWPSMPRPCSEPNLSLDTCFDGCAPSSPSSDDSLDSEADTRLGRRGHGWSVSPAAKPLLIVSSMDGFFFVKGDGADWGSEGTEAQKFLRAKNATVLDMVLAGALKPGVVVLTGDDGQREAVERDILRQAADKAGALAAQVERVELREEEDKDKVRRSLFRGARARTHTHTCNTQIHIYTHTHARTHTPFHSLSVALYLCRTLSL